MLFRFSAPSTNFAKAIVRLHDGLDMVHGDICWRNMVFSRAHGGAVLLDFGNAFYMHERVRGPWDSHRTWKNEGGGRVTSVDDLFALGETLVPVRRYQLLFFGFSF